MSMRLVTLATFPSPVEAALARNILAEAGIRAEATEGATASTWGGMFGGVKLLVDEADLERAGNLLDEALSDPLEAEDEPDAQKQVDTAVSDFAENLADRSPAEGRPAWKCAVCGARNEEDEGRCWSCGESRSGEVNPYFTRGDTMPEGNSHEYPPDAIVLNNIAEVVNRAWRAAWMGIPLLPFAQLYSAWLLWTAADQVSHFTSQTRRRFYIAFAFDVLVLGVIIVLIVLIFRP